MSRSRTEARTDSASKGEYGSFECCARSILPSLTASASSMARVASSHSRSRTSAARSIAASFSSTSSAVMVRGGSGRSLMAELLLRPVNFLLRQRYEAVDELREKSRVRLWPK
ncbi:hypothetical protein [Streptomyces acidiscabies]|uniref:hypothetical protein n=1 Tax=Streptomyces acidiscabies TaxID=42234 RepID=UPI00131D3B45|nr:hypothetical protein [Streptomyces acidiscabies]